MRPSERATLSRRDCHLRFVDLHGCAVGLRDLPGATHRSFRSGPCLRDEITRQFGAAALFGIASRPRRRPGRSRLLDLETLTLAAYYFNPDLDAARARSATSEAATKTAAQRPNPSLQLPFGYTSNPRRDESPYLLGLGMDIPIETAGKRRYRIDQARKLSMAARLNIGNVAWQVRSRLRTQLLDMYAARHRAEVVGPAQHRPARGRHAASALGRRHGDARIKGGRGGNQRHATPIARGHSGGRPAHGVARSAIGTSRQAPTRVGHRACRQSARERSPSRRRGEVPSHSLDPCDRR